MKLSSIFCLTLIVIAIIMSLTQFWFAPITTALFIRVMLSIVAVFLITIAGILVKQESIETDKLQKDNLTG